MRNTGRSAFLLLLALSVVVWGCSGGGGSGSSPTSPGFEDVSAERRAKDDSVFEMAITGLFSPDWIPGTPCSGDGSNCIPNIQFYSSVLLQGTYGPGINDGPIDESKVVTFLKENATCVSDLIDQFAYTNYFIITKDRKSAGVTIVWDFFVRLVGTDRQQRWELHIDGLLAGGDDFPPLQSEFSTVNVGSAEFHRGHGKSTCTVPGPNATGTVRIEKMQ